MARAENTEFIDLFEEFYRDYYRNEIGELAQKYPNDQKSLFVDWQDLYRFDPDLAEDYRNKPEQLQEYAEEALRLFDLPIDVKLGQAHVRMTNLPESTDIRDIRADHRGQLVSIQGIIRKATEVRPKITDAAFECQRCGTLTRIPQSTGDFQEPHECQGCERQGPFRINFDQSEFIDAQKLRVQESPEGLRGGETPQNIDVNIEDDITGNVTAGDHVRVTGVLKLDQRGNDREKSAMFDVYMNGVSVEIEDEEFEEMDIDEDDKKEIVALSEQGDIYEQMTDSIAPSIYGYDQEKLAIALQLFSGVTKHLPDESRIRGDLHVLLIGDPGTGKCIKYDTRVQLADGTTSAIGELVEANLDDPKPVDDGVWDHASIPLPTLAPDGSLTTAEATKVWKREAPEHLYRIRTESGRELDVTPSHPLFVQQDGTPTAMEAENLEEGQFVATPRSVPAAGDDRIEVDYRDVLPVSGETLREIRESLALSQSDCGLSRATYQHYERGDRNPSRESLRAVVEAFKKRLAWLKDQREGLAADDWKTIVELRDELGISQQSLADGMDVTQTAISYYERNEVAPDGGETVAASGVVRDRLQEALAVESTVDRLGDLATNDVRWDRIASIEAVESDDEWVYDLEVEGTHSYVSNGVVSHNSQILQYIRHIAPRSVFTSGKGSSSAGLCVTGDTRIQTEDGFRQIRDVVIEELPEPVAAETAAERSIDVQTFHRDDGEIDTRASSHVWRMPEKPTRRIETEYGKELEASVNTPVLTCGGEGIEWTEISDVEAGDFIAAPRFGDLDRSEVAVRDFLMLTTEKVRLTEESIEFLRTELTEEFGTLRDAAAALDLSEDFIYLHLKNRHVPLEKLDRMLEAIDATRSAVDFERLMVRHGDSITIPETFDTDLMYLLGLVFGDGDISLDRRDGNRGMVRISNGNERLLERAADIFEAKFDKRPEIERQDDRVPCIRVNSVTIARLFENAGMESPKKDLALAPELTITEHGDAFLRGLMDADGSVSVRGEKGGSSVLLSTISEALGEQVQLMLESYGVKARLRERDRRGTTELANGQEIESGHVQYFLEMYGAEIDRYAEAIGFESVEKQTALEEIVREERRQPEKIPVGSALAAVEGVAGDYYQNVNRGDNPGRTRARSMLADIDLGPVEPLVEEAVEADLRWEEVVAAVDTGEKEVFDLTVPETHNFLGNGLVTHNTAAAVRDDFGDGQQWTLEAGALVLADRGIAAVDELDKMRCVAGDTLVQAGDGQRQIRELAVEAAEKGSIEELSNGRTIRDVDLDVWTMTDDETLTKRPVTAIHEYDAPETLYEVTLSTGGEVTVTPDHPFFIDQDSGRVETPAEELQPGDQVFVPEGTAMATDGGTVQIDPASDSLSPGESRPCEIGLRTVEQVDTVPDHDYGSVYDLTVEGTHNFVANGMIVHNSEDRSAMHEALEQQSYHPDSEILLADGRRVEIGDFVDERMAERSDDVIDGVECEILPVDDVRVHSADLDDNDVQKLPVDRVSRHEAPEEFVRVSFSNGREVIVTPEHPMFVAPDGDIDTLEARHVDEGDFVPAPRKLPNSAATVPLEDESQNGKEKDIALPAAMSPDLAEILGFLIAEGHSYAGSAHEIGFSNQDERLLDRMDELMGRVFGMESTDTTNAAGTVTKRWVSTQLYRWFQENFPEFMHTARDKRIPSKVLGASEEEVRRFLVGAFQGDGGVESEAMAFSTASPGLAEDYADALAKIGVASRIHHDDTEDSWKTYVMGDSTEKFVETVVQPSDDRYDDARSFVERSNETPRHHDVLPTDAAQELRELRNLLGLRKTGQFKPNLDNGFGVHIGTVEAELDTLRERAEEIRSELEAADDLAAVRNAIGWSGRQLAERLENETTSAVHYAESGGYDAERRASLTKQALEAAKSALTEFEQRAEALESQADLRYYRVTDVETLPNEGEHATDWVYDVTVEPTNTFVSQGVVLHNSISISKAGINATLKSRCSLLGAANPKYGRFDQYEPIGEQIDLEPALISRFDLIFTVTDQPDEEEDANLAEHILRTNYAGELNTHRQQNSTPDYSAEEVENVTETVAPEIDPELLRKYVAYAKRSCFPTMTEEAKAAIRDFYVELRTKGSGEDAPVPVTARKLEALVRLAEASARVRLSDTVEEADAERVIGIVRSSLEDIGIDPETGELDADVVETGTSKSQRDRIKNIRGIIADIEEEYDEGAPVDVVIERAEEVGMEASKAEHEIEKLKQQGEVYEPRTDHLRTT